MGLLSRAARSAGKAARVAAYRGERGDHLQSMSRRFYTLSPDVANTHALPDGLSGAANGGRVYRDNIDVSGFGRWDMAQDAPTLQTLEQMEAYARARGLPGLVLENVGEIATPTSGKARHALDDQLLIFNLERILANR